MLSTDNEGRARFTVAPTGPSLFEEEEAPIRPEFRRVEAGGGVFSPMYHSLFWNVQQCAPLPVPPLRVFAAT